MRRRIFPVGSPVVEKPPTRTHGSAGSTSVAFWPWQDGWETNTIARTGFCRGCSRHGLSGTNDTGASYYLSPDANYLIPFGTIIRDWEFNGGHQTPPDSVLSDMLNWLIAARVSPGPSDKTER